MVLEQEKKHIWTSEGSRGGASGAKPEPTTHSLEARHVNQIDTPLFHKE